MTLFGVQVEAAPPRKVPPAALARETLEAAIRYVKQHAWRRDAVQWEVVEPRVREMAAGAATPAEVHPAIRHLLSALGDRHSFLMAPAKAKEFRARPNVLPTVRALPERVGYINVPGYTSNSQRANRDYATRMYESIDAIDESAPCGWIVDLRANQGGIIWPMFAGLKPFLGDVPIGSVQTPDGARESWTAGARVVARMPATLRALEMAWVAIVTGPRTASAGEAVAIAFRGRPNTRSFGQPTYGVSTGNSGFTLPDGSLLMLTTSVQADRTGQVYGGALEPDERVADDEALAAATRWLTQASGCGQ